MTEAEWLECTDPDKRLCYFRGRLRNGFNRKIRLFACACCRRIWDHFVDERSRVAVEVAERYADGEATDEELSTAFTAAGHAHQEVFQKIGKAGACIEWAAKYAADPIPFHGARNVIWMAATSRSYEIRRKRPHEWDAIRLFLCEITRNSGPFALVVGKWNVKRLRQAVATGAEKPIQMALLNDIFGNPFHPITIDPTWLTPTVKVMAQAIYTDRNFDQMPLLADELEKAGCDNQEILGHCRGPGPHVRGCWVVDLVLGEGVRQWRKPTG
jgi:hypothetical protein